MAGAADPGWRENPIALNLSPEQAEQRARELLDDPLLNQIFAEMDHDAAYTWRSSSSPVQREEQWHATQAIADIRRRLTERLAKSADIARNRLAQRRPQGMP